MIGGFVAAAALVLLASWKVPPDDVPRIGLLSAAFFVGSLIHLPLGLGGSAHMILNGLLGVVLRHRAPVAVAVGIVLQSFLFGHGGKTTIGINIAVVALPALAAGWAFPAARRWFAGRAWLLGCLLGTGTALASIALNAAVIALLGRTEYLALAGVVLAANLPFAVAEGVATGAVVGYLAKVKPEWLGQPPSGNTSSNGTSH